MGAKILETGTTLVVEAIGEEELQALMSLSPGFDHAVVGALAMGSQAALERGGPQPAAS